MDHKKINWRKMSLDYAAYVHERCQGLMEAIKELEESSESACLITDHNKLQKDEYLEEEIDHAMAQLYRRHSDCPFGYGYVPAWHGVYIYKLKDLNDLLGIEDED